jgi:hypothetical protein
MSRPAVPRNSLLGAFVLTVRTEVTDRMLIFSGRRHRPLRSVLPEYSASRIQAQVEVSCRVLAPHKIGSCCSELLDRTLIWN